MAVPNPVWYGRVESGAAWFGQVEQGSVKYGTARRVSAVLLLLGN